MSKTGIAIRVGFILALISLLSLPRVAPLSSAQSGGNIELAVDTANPSQDGLLAIFAELRFGGEIGLPVGAGDINGDNRADVIFCQMYASAGAGNRRHAEGRRNEGAMRAGRRDGHHPHGDDPHRR